MDIYKSLSDTLGVEYIPSSDSSPQNNFIPLFSNRSGFEGKNHTDETKLLLSKPKSEETKQKISATMKSLGYIPPSQKGVKRTEETKAKISISIRKSISKGKNKNIIRNKDPKTDTHKQKISISVSARLSCPEIKEKMCKPRKEMCCPVCGLVGRGGIMKRYHFTNCKSIPKSMG